MKDGMMNNKATKEQSFGAQRPESGLGSLVSLLFNKLLDAGATLRPVEEALEDSLPKWKAES
jgi:hypothetical protein